MDLDSCSVSRSSSSSMPSSAADVVEEDPMVHMEFEAAEALADLAHLAMRENGSVGGSGPAETATNWASKGKRVRKRVKSESPPGHSGLDLNPFDPVPRSSDPVDERTLLDQQQDHQTTCSNVIITPVKAEEDAESLQPSSTCPTKYISMGDGRLRQNLTEVDKEARRIRRILANRESARQTIRRRQALCEELTRKAADLALENEGLKREKELAFREYQSLETINKHLKEQVAKAMNAEISETPGAVKSAHADTSSSPANCPLLLYNHHPLLPLGWPSIIQSSLPVQSRHGPQNAAGFPSNIPTASTGNLASPQEQENAININATRAPLYLVPCPWFFPLHDSAQPCGSLEVIQDETCMHNGPGGSSSSKTMANMENHHFLLPIKVKDEASGLPDARSANDLNDIPVESPLSGGGQHSGSHPRESTLTPAPQATSGGTFIKHDNILQLEYTCHMEAVSTKASHIVSPLPEKKQETVDHPSKKLVNAAAAAEARKRRKELTKLKNLHGRQCRMQC